MITKSFRIDEKTAKEVDNYASGLTFTQVMHQALAAWLQERRRQHRDDLVRQSCQARSEAELAEFDEIVEQAGQSVRGLLKDE